MCALPDSLTLALWTPEETAAKKAAWIATAARLAATLPMESGADRTAYLAAVEAAVGCTYAHLQRAICQAAGPAPASVVAHERRIMSRGEPTRGTYDGPGDDRDRGRFSQDMACLLALVA
jgi:hypothetical protein